MKIFIVRINEFLKSIDKTSFENIYKSDKRNLEFQLGRFLTRYIASNIFGISNTEIAVDNKKPYFKNTDLSFSISHSNDILGVAFSNSVVGLDIEKFKPRNLDRLSDYFKKQFKTLEEFYQYWTIYEANYKSKLSNEVLTSLRFEDYFVSVSCEKNEELKMYEVASPIDITNPIELISLKLVNDSNINDIKLDINEINTASFEFLPPLAIKME